MEFRILGCLEADGDGGPVQLGGPSAQKLLAALLLDTGRTVQLAHLIDVLWDDDPPATAEKQVRNAAAGLRRLLAASGAPGLIVTCQGGYRLAADSDRVDAGLFDRGVLQASRAAAAGQIAEAARLLKSALALWRGPFLAGLTGRVVEAAAIVWEERRCAAAEAFYAHQLALGRHHEVVAELQAFSAEQPLRDKPAGQLMLALYLCGRQADALAAYDRVRMLLAEEMGLDPSPHLRRLRQQILAGDPALVRVPDGDEPAEARPARPVPRQLPAKQASFTGREAELRALTVLAEEAARDGRAAISVIAGVAGAGKTTLAVQWAHQVASRFPDGQMYVNLRGYGPAESAMSPDEAVRAFLHALAVPPRLIPAERDAQVGLYRSELAGKRVLVVADNARDSAQVQPLVPGAPGCMLLVTSRHELTGLIATSGARPLTLGLLSRQDCRELLAARLGAGRVAAEPRAAEEIITSCARLPLALSIAAARAAAHPSFPLTALAGELSSIRGRLDALTADDPANDPRTAFSLSYQQLTMPAARLFRLLGWHPLADLSTSAAASLAGLPAAATRPLLAELARAHLLTEHLPGRFSCHDLLHAYAVELADGTETQAVRQAAELRMLDHYLHTADRAAHLVSPHPLHRPVTLPAPRTGVTLGHLTTQEEALAWFDAEHLVLLATVSQAWASGWDKHAWQLPSALMTYLYRRGRWHDLAAVQRTALAAARRAADLLGQARAHEGIGSAYRWLGRHDDANTHLRRALALYPNLGDQDGEASIHQQLAWILDRQGRAEEALRHDRKALALYRAAGHESGQASALNNIGWDLTRRGDYRQAIDFCERALTLFRLSDDHRGMAHALDSLGYACHKLARHYEAIAHYQQALVLQQQACDPPDQACTLNHLGDACHAAGDQDAALAAWRQALDILERLGHSDADPVRQKLLACR